MGLSLREGVDSGIEVRHEFTHHYNESRSFGTMSGLDITAPRRLHGSLAMPAGSQ